MKSSRTVDSNPIPTDDSWESDAVWKLLDQAAPVTTRTRFIDDTVRAARLLGEVKPWWKRVLAPLPLAGIAGATAAMIFSTITLFSPTPISPAIQSTAANSIQAANIQEIAETETLIVAADHLENFSDKELVSLIGF